MEMLRYTCVQISPLWFASLRSEEVVIRKSSHTHTHTHIIGVYTAFRLACIIPPVMVNAVRKLHRDTRKVDVLQ